MCNSVEYELQPLCFVLPNSDLNLTLIVLETSLYNFYANSVDLDKRAP